MYGSPESIGQEIVRTARISEGAEPDGNDRAGRIKWAAGFFDGDGSVGIYMQNKGRTYALYMSSVQVNPAPLKELQALFGGPVHERPGFGKRRDYHQWVISGKNAGAALREMSPYLIGKAEEAQVAIEFQDRREPQHYREMTDDERSHFEGARQRLMELKQQTYR